MRMLAALSVVTLLCLSSAAARADVAPPDSTTTKDSTASDTSSKTDTGTNPSGKDDSGCAIVANPWHARGVAALCLCLGLGLLVVAGRRRRRERQARRE
ncbi:MAG: hypothetical protein KC503_24335 [Myxococcales bacterium]|nr:hypothetical protein [Myxococcales bacterium]